MSEKHTSESKFPPHTAGRSMITHVPKAKITGTLADIRDDLYQTLYATINYIYVTLADGKLVGVVTLKDLFRRPPETLIKDIMKTDIYTVRGHSDRAKAAVLAVKHGLKSIPVVDKEEKLLGIVDSDSLMRIINSEASDALLGLSGIVSEEGGDVMSMSLITSLKHRLPWLILGLFGGMFTATIISFFETTLQKNLVLASFIPLIVYMAGAVGNQMLVLLIREYSLAPKIKVANYFRKQIPIVATIGVIGALILFLLSFLMFGSLEVSKALSIALFIAVSSSLLSGIFIPQLFKKLGIDPADASGPISTVLQDLMSVSIYLGVASILL